jgi:hypothetical protein
LSIGDDFESIHPSLHLKLDKINIYAASMQRCGKQTNFTLNVTIKTRINSQNHLFSSTK